MTEIETPYPEYDDLSITELALELADLKDKVEEADRKKKDLQKKFDYLRHNKIPTKMDDEGLSSVRVKNLGTLSLQPDAWTQTVNSDELLKWLIQNGHEDLIKETVNPSTLKAFAKQQIKNGEELPPDDIFKFTPFTRASITKR